MKIITISKELIIFVTIKSATMMPITNLSIILQLTLMTLFRKLTRMVIIHVIFFITYVFNIIFTLYFLGISGLGFTYLFRLVA